MKKNSQKEFRLIIINCCLIIQVCNVLKLIQIIGLRLNDGMLVLFIKIRVTNFFKIFSAYILGRGMVGPFKNIFILNYAYSQLYPSE